MDQHGLMTTPFLLGLANAVAVAYYGNNFVSTDIDSVHGTLSGASGATLMSLGAATVGLQTVALAKTLQHATTGRHTSRRMKWVIALAVLFLVVSLTTALLSVVLVADYGALDVTVSAGGVLQSTYGNAVLATDYVTFGVGGLLLIGYAYLQFKSETMLALTV